jgi:hypothetical protein
MMNSVSRKAPRFVTAVLLLCACGFLDSAFAGSVNLKGTYSAGDIKASCAANGGQYLSGGGNFDYGCYGSAGVVTCTRGKCTGSCEKCGTRQSIGGRIGIVGVLKPPTASTQFYRAGTFRQPMATYQSFGRHK